MQTVINVFEQEHSERILREPRDLWAIVEKLTGQKGEADTSCAATLAAGKEGE